MLIGGPARRLMEVCRAIRVPDAQEQGAAAEAAYRVFRNSNRRAGGRPTRRAGLPPDRRGGTPCASQPARHPAENRSLL